MSASRVLAVAAVLALFGAPGVAEAKFMSCRLDYRAHAWSIFYKNVTGTGAVKCDDGTTARVKLKMHGGGFTFGVSDMEGTARFAKVRDIGEVFGTYGSLEGHAGLSKSVEGRVMTNGPIWVSQAGKGRGFDLGFAFGGFSVRRD
ncbi:MAG TPA: hypothetical protein VIY27_05860 [Myxococcota bacterium]